MPLDKQGFTDMGPKLLALEYVSNVISFVTIAPSRSHSD
jgi:hypothetical protein